MILKMQYSRKIQPVGTSKKPVGMHKKTRRQSTTKPYALQD